MLRAREGHISKPPRDWFLLGIALALEARPAQAYIDPGSGALVMQVVLSALFGTLFLARRTLRNILVRLGLTSASRGTAPPEQAPDSDRGHQ